MDTKRKYRTIIPYDAHLKEFARQLRNNSTLSEVLLWQRVKKGQICGLDFHRQKPLLHYIVDFYCPDLMLAIEIDGSSHDGKEAYDMARQTALEAKGVTFLRFADLEVKQNLDAVVAEIEGWVLANKDLYV